MPQVSIERYEVTQTYASGSRPSLVLADLLPGHLTRDIALVAGSAAFVGVAAQVSVPLPFTPVPVTGQTFAVLLSVTALGPLRGVAGMLVYLLAGMAGMPWFADAGAGWHSASFGYVIGFLLAAAVVGTLAQRGGDRSPLRTAATMTLGTLLIYVAGVPWLMGFLGVGLTKALALGVVPFLLGDVLKVAIAAGLLPSTWALLGKRR